MKHLLIKGTAAALLAGLSALPAAAAENPMATFGIRHNRYLGCLQDIGAPSADSLALLVDKCGYDAGTTREAFIKQGQPILDMDPMQPLAEKMAPYRKHYSA